MRLNSDIDRRIAFIYLFLIIDRRITLKTFLSYCNIKTKIIWTKMKTRQLEKVSCDFAYIILYKYYICLYVYYRVTIWGSSPKCMES